MATAPAPAPAGASSPWQPLWSACAGEWANHSAGAALPLVGSRLRAPIGRIASPRRGPMGIDGGERPLELSCLGAERAMDGSPSASREETPARLISLAAQNVNCQRFSVVALLLCGDSAGQAGRMRSAQRVRVCRFDVGRKELFRNGTVSHSKHLPFMNFPFEWVLRDEALGSQSHER
ncbi:uncharacterized protein LOC134524295 [Chroicocephalus ridibundus]|uniref:uncharacterized protein LOC134524295 n=1 Tax=Chroicocephalus ridibundus TaxID=1192867 RepID=UPI002FDE8799